MLTRISQLLNALLVGAIVALPFSDPAMTGLIARAEPGAEGGAREAPKLDGRLPAAIPLAAMPQPTPPPPVEGRTDALVPPLIRKRPQPAPTSVPIVAAPEKKKSAVAPVVAKGPAAVAKGAKPAAPKPVTAQPSVQPASKKAAPAGRSSLGGPKSLSGPKPSAACATGMTFDSRLLKCVTGAAPHATPKAQRAPAAALRPAAAPTAAATTKR